eukprot:1368205-Rhodomonas_salina.2
MSRVLFLTTIFCASSVESSAVIALRVPPTKKHGPISLVGVTLMYTLTCRRPLSSQIQRLEERWVATRSIYVVVLVPRNAQLQSSCLKQARCYSRWPTGARTLATTHMQTSHTNITYTRA